MIINGTSLGFYNDGIGFVLNGTDPGFPAGGDPFIPNPDEPNLSAAAGILGDWLEDPPDLSVPWTGPQLIPSTWAPGTETAVLYPFGDDDTTYASVTIRIGVDNGAFVWLDGVYLGGLVSPGGVVPGELTLTVKDLAPREHFLQIIREDHGGVTGFFIEVLATLASPFVFDEPQEFATTEPAFAQATGDFDENGLVDLVAVVPGTGSVRVFLNRGVTDGVWDGFDALDPIVVGTDPRDVAVGDFDLDGDPDIAVTLFGEDAIRVLTNNGTMDGAFTLEPPIPVGADPWSVAAADFTGEGAADVAVILSGADAVVILANDAQPAGGSGGGGANVSFTLIETINATGVSSGLCPEDIDEDKDIDLIIAQREQDSVRVSVLDGGLEIASTTVDVGDGPVDITGADFDGNGFTDFATANSGGGSASIALNDGPKRPGGAPIFRPAQTEPAGANPTTVQAVDIDADGDPDLAVTADDPETGPSVRVLENQGADGTPG